MKRIAVFLLLLAVAISGCTTKSKAKAQARAAFVAGQQQGLSQQIRQQTQIVLVRGPVKNQIIPWDEELTLTKAILTAEYQGFGNPKEIDVTRQGETIRFDPRQLLRGEDLPLQVGDIVDILR